MTDAANEKVWSTIQKMVPFDVLMDGKSEEHRRWYRIPSWRVVFDVDALRGVDVRLHKSLDGPHSWALSEATTGHKMYEGFDATDDEPGTSSDVLHEFVALVLPRLTREIVESSIAKARELLKTLPQCPFVERLSSSTAIAPFGWYGMMGNGDGTESPRFEAGAKPWCLKEMKDAKPLYSAPSASATSWIAITDKLPPVGTLSVVLSSRADDADDMEGIDQYEGSWVIRPHQQASEEAIRRWAERHQVTHWMPLPSAHTDIEQSSQEKP